MAVDRIRSELDACTAAELTELSAEIDARLESADNKFRLASVLDQVAAQGWCVCTSLLEVDDDQLTYCEETIEFRVSTHDKRGTSGAHITEIRNKQKPWVKSLKYKYPVDEEDVEGSTEWDDGPDEWESGDWDDPDTASVWRKVWIYVRARPLECPPAGTRLKVLNDSCVERWTSKSDGLYDKHKTRVCKRSEWPARDEGTDWFILSMRPPVTATAKPDDEVDCL